MPNKTKLSLGYISLRWMVQEVIEAQCGVLFDMNEVMELQAKTDPERKHNDYKHLPRNEATSRNENRPETTAQNNLDPALASIHDQLALKRGWWILEYLPTFPSWQDEDGVWRNLKKLR